MVRITGGIHRGRTLHTPKHWRTRPTQAKLRQALFNSLHTSIVDARVLDLFSGSGALGFEGLSRGASEAVFVESDRLAAQLIERNAQELRLSNQSKLLEMSVDSALKKLLSLGPFDIVLADPPYDQGWELKLLNTWPWEQLLVVGGFLYLEWGFQKSVVSELPETVSCLLKVREKRYGDSVLTTFKRF